MMEFGFELEEATSEKDFRKKVKTQEELDKLTVPEHLSEIDKAIYILDSGQRLQYLSVVNSLPDLLKVSSDACLNKVLPKVKNVLTSADNNLHTAASQTFARLGTDIKVSPAIFSQHFLKIALNHLKSSDFDVAEIWTNSFSDMISRVPPDVITKEVLPVAVLMGQLSKPTASRLLCCKVIGGIAGKFDLNTIKKELVPKITLLCQDVDQDVRACMCTHIHSIAHAMGANDTQNLIMSEIMELATDEEYQVRVAAFDAYLTITDLLGDDTKLEMKPLIESYCDQAIQQEDSTLLSVSKSYGQLCESVAHLLSDDEMSNFVDIYQRMCLLGRRSLENEPNLIQAVHERLAEMRSENFSKIRPLSSMSMVPHPQDLKKDDLLECRRYSAFNLPAMFQIFSNEEFSSTLMDCSLILSSDDDVIVRKRVAAGLHEIARVLGPQAFALKVHLETVLCQDQSVEVVDGCLNHLGETLIQIVNTGNMMDPKFGGLNEVTTALLTVLNNFEKKWSLTWRPWKSLVVQLRCLPDILPSEQIHHKFFPILFSMLTKNHYLPVRKAASHTICVLLRFNNRTDQRREILDKLVQTLCRSKSYRDRLLFLDLCQDIMLVFSRRFFKQSVFVHAMSLFDDKVPNVRLSLCRILPSMKMLLRLPDDRSLHSQLEEGTRKFLSSETDKDVARAIRMTILELDKTAVKRTAQHDFSVEDFEDQRKEEEENVLASEEKSDDRAVRTGSFSVMSMKAKNGKNTNLKKRQSTASFAGGKPPTGLRSRSDLSSSLTRTESPLNLPNSSSYSALHSSSVGSSGRASISSSMTDDVKSRTRKPREATRKPSETMNLSSTSTSTERSDSRRRSETPNIGSSRRNKAPNLSESSTSSSTSNTKVRERKERKK